MSGLLIDERPLGLFPCGVHEGRAHGGTFDKGLVPGRHRGTLADFKYATSNARSDTLLDKAMFRNALEAGRRCLVLVEGFYEWATVEERVPGKQGVQKVKQPYYIYPKGTSGDTHSHPSLLRLAGIYDIWKVRV